jgi:nicotinamide-nucleotide adenylyltransferase
MRIARSESTFSRLGIVARWKPVHLGHAAVLEALVAHAEEVLIGVGSSNRYDRDNPFTAAESAAMIRAVLGEHGNVEVVEVRKVRSARRVRHRQFLCGRFDAGGLPGDPPRELDST